MIVMKFGGTSVADQAAIERLMAIVRAARQAAGQPESKDWRGPVVVVSALGGLLGGVSGQQLGRLRASRLVRSAPLLGALAGLVLGDIAWLAALLVAGDTATVSGTVGTVLSASAPAPIWTQCGFCP